MVAAFKSRESSEFLPAKQSVQPANAPIERRALRQSMTFEEWIKIAPAYLAAFAAIIGFYYTDKNLKLWRTSMLGKHEFDTARNLMTSVVKLEDAMNRVRNSYFPKEPSESFQKILTAQRDFESTLIEARVIWGAARIEVPAFAMFSCLRKLTAAMRRLARAEMPEFARRSEPTEHEMRRLDEADRIVFGGDPGEPDSFGTDLKAAVAMFEIELRQYLPRAITFSEKISRLILRLQSADDITDVDEAETKEPGESAAAS
jgi:hypothetical protein